MKIKDLKIENEEIELAGKKFALNLDMNAMVELEDYYGDIKKAFKNFKVKPMQEMRTFLYAMLKTQIEDLTVEATGALITAKNFNELFTKITKIMNNAFPQNEKTEADEDPNA